MKTFAGSVSVGDLSGDPHPILHKLRSTEPVAWVDSLSAWLVTGYDLCVEVMLDPDTFTVDDPRFSTGQVIGPSMLSLDGVDHRRHRDPFGGPFRSAAVNQLREFSASTAARLLADVAARGSGDLRAKVAGPLAVAVMAKALDLEDVDVDDVLGWYEEIVAAVHTVTAGGDVPASALAAFEDLKGAVARNRSSSSLLDSVEEALTVDEIASNVAVLLFGGIVTSESSSAIAFRYLLRNPDMAKLLREDRSKVRGFVEEAFRLEPSAAAVDRYATRDVRIGDAAIRAGELVRVSLSAANRDPSVFKAPDRFDMARANHGRNVTFARGPHGCLGIHLARLETVAAVDALLDHQVDAGQLDGIEGLVFRAPATVEAKFS